MLLSDSVGKTSFAVYVDGKALVWWAHNATSVLRKKDFVSGNRE